MTDREHIHGGDPQRQFHRLGLSPREVMDFSVNVSPLGVPAEVRAVWDELFQEIHRYPSIDGRGLGYYYQKRFGLEPEMVLAGNGSTELIYLVPRALGLKKVAVISPSFHDYTRASLAAGARLLEVPLKTSESFAPPRPEVLEEAIRDADALFMGNPNNPTGTVFARRLILDLAAAFPGKWFLVDEAFVQFLPEPEKVSLLGRKPFANVLVFHSLTKFYALAGLRLGAVAGHPDTISLLRPFKEPWSVNRIAEKVALRLLDCSSYEQRLRQLLHGERPRVFRRLQAMPGIEAFEPSANFILGRWLATPALDDLLYCLLQSGIHVRDCRNFTGLEENFFRLAVRLPQENDYLLAVLQACITRHP